MNIAIDARCLEGNKTGVGRYLGNIIQNFPNSEKDTNLQLYCTVDFSLTADVNLQKKIVKGHPLLWKQFLVPLHQLIDKPDVFFVPSYSTPIFNPIPTVVTIHDLIFTKFPEWTDRKQRWRFKNIVTRSAKYASKIIAVSESTRKDIINLTDVKSEKVEVVYEGIDSKFEVLSKSRAIKLIKNLDIQSDFILYVGSMHPRRNLHRLLHAFKGILHKGMNNYKLMLCGLNLYTKSDVNNWIDELGLKDYVRILGYVTEEELLGLYNMATVFVYPSLYEGFGLPILESMACGTPVLTSNVSAIPEVAADAALLVDPYSIDELSSGLQSLLKSEKLRKEFIERGHARKQLFSWENTAKQTSEILKSVVR
ncbi:MAG: glycosyltransferase family 1 protein [Calditrichaeota bacterium]|nr:MAG: glycosyltransferase family 1 protein [Calditrichota bacterium]